MSTSNAFQRLMRAANARGKGSTATVPRRVLLLMLSEAALLASERQALQSQVEILQIQRDEARARRDHVERFSLAESERGNRLNREAASLRARVKHGRAAVALLNRERDLYRDMLRESERLFLAEEPPSAGGVAIVPQPGPIQSRKEHCADTEKCS